MNEIIPLLPSFCMVTSSPAPAVGKHFIGIFRDTGYVVPVVFIVLKFSVYIYLFLHNLTSFPSKSSNCLYKLHIIVAMLLIFVSGTGIPNITFSIIQVIFFLIFNGNISSLNPTTTFLLFVSISLCSLDVAILVTGHFGWYILCNSALLSPREVLAAATAWGPQAITLFAAAAAPVAL